MNRFYKIFLAILILTVGLGFYAIDWKLGFLNEENTTFVFSIAAGLLGIILVLVMNMWSKLAIKK